MKIKFLLIILIPVMLSSCGEHTKKHKTLKIALSWATENYINWVHRVDSTVEVIDMKGLSPDSAVALLAECNGLILTGGDDIDPSRYGKTEDSARCTTNPGRDSLEFALVKKALKMKMPVFGICRGLQLMNVAKEGTLVVDIPSDYPDAITHRCDDYLHCDHRVTIRKETLLYEITKLDSGMVNTNHHQAIAAPGKDFSISARSADGLPEAIEWEDPKGKGYFMAVQWHPERMPEGDPLSDPLLKAYLQACIIFKVMN